MIGLAPKELAIVRAILSKYPYRFYAFGSRAKGTQRRFSDLDLCYKDAIPERVLAELDAAFEESDLPFKVDLINFSKISDDFKRLIEKDLGPI
ncbi:MAG: nucleotidyltransferase domain-containing protein [Candidatus Dependentiae bacterium]|jgi:predicted nucleotidyltransferase|nr:nucleotidyltransferase domain-containing protein [Candidatus Dependentiae bacterium]